MKRSLNLDRVATGGSDPRLVVDADPDQGRDGRRQRLLDQTLKVLLVGRPGAVGKTARGGDGDDVGHRGGGRRLRAGDLIDAIVHHDHGEVLRR